MEQIKTPTLADNFLWNFEAQLHILQGDPEAYDKLVEKKVGELEKYLGMRIAKQKMGDEKFRDLIKDNQEMTDFYDMYELPLGGNPPALSLGELQEYIQKIKSLSTISDTDLPPEVLK